MDFILNAVSNMLNKVAGGASTYCSLIFFEAEVPKSLREE